jgi:uncharacterized Zn finger protein (UPF0148 family)
MIYTCNSCHFTFRRSGKIEDCPDCGKPSVREATEKEKTEYKKNQAEYEKTEKQNKNKQ